MRCSFHRWCGHCYGSDAATLYGWLRSGHRTLAILPRCFLSFLHLHRLHCTGYIQRRQTVSFQAKRILVVGKGQKSPPHHDGTRCGNNDTCCLHDGTHCPPEHVRQQCDPFCQGRTDTAGYANNHKNSMPCVSSVAGMPSRREARAARISVAPMLPSVFASDIA